MDNARVRLIIEGRVQGVWFRESTRRKALSLGVTGWVKNRMDGTVEALIEGPEDQVEALVAWCHHGPSGAHVSKVHRSSEKWRGQFDSFGIQF